MAFRLFISHSSPGEAAHTRLLDIVRQLHDQSAGAVHALVDAHEIKGGDEWRRRIGHLLTMCDAAVILLDRPAVLSRWVLAEAMVLSTRRAVEGGFRLIPVALLPSADFERAKADRAELAEAVSTGSWGPVALGEVQWLDGHTPADIATRVLEILGTSGGLTSAETPLERFAHDLADVLERAPGSRLRELADSLDEQLSPTVFPPEDAVHRSALAVAKAFIEASTLLEAAGCLSRLGDIFRREHGQTLINQLSPVAFDAAAAAFLIRPRRGGGYETVVLQADNVQYSVEGHLRLAHLPQAVGHPVYYLTAPYATVSTLRDELLQQHRDRLSTQFPREAFSDDELLASLRLMPFVMCTPAVDAALLAAMATEFPTASFIVVHPSDATPPSLPGVVRVLPVLGRTREQSIRLAHATALAALNPFGAASPLGGTR